jgi:hypothetical protein
MYTLNLKPREPHAGRDDLPTWIRYVLGLLAGIIVFRNTRYHPSNRKV